MQRYVQYIFALLIVVCIAACGGGSTTAATQVYTHRPVPVTIDQLDTHRLIGGTVQGTELTLSNTVSSFTGTPGKDGVGFTNYSGNSSDTAKFNQPNDITTDGKDFYVADFGNSIIRRIYTDVGEVKTSTLECVDSDGNAVGFSYPRGITTDGTHLYVADSGYNCIRVITIIPDAVTKKHTVITIGSTTGLTGSVDSTDKTAVRFHLPTGITTDGVNVYVTDYNNATVRWIDTSQASTGDYAVYTMAGASGAVGSTDSDDPTAARFNLPARITTDGKNLYVTDVLNRTIRQISIATGKVTTLAGSTGEMSTDNGTLNGTGAAARFHQPNGITTDGINLYVTDSYLAIIRKIVISTGEVTTLSLSGGSLLTPIGITTDGNSLFVADTYYISREDKSYIDTYTYSDSIIKIQ